MFTLSDYATFVIDYVTQMCALSSYVMDNNLW